MKEAFLGYPINASFYMILQPHPYHHRIMIAIRQFGREVALSLYLLRVEHIIDSQQVFEVAVGVHIAMSALFETILELFAFHCMVGVRGGK